MKKKYIAVLTAAVMGIMTVLTGCGGQAASQKADEQSSDTEQTVVQEQSADTEGTAVQEQSADTEGTASQEKAEEESTASDIGEGRLTMGGLSFPTGDMVSLKEPEEVEKVSSEEVSRMDRALREYTPPADSLLVNAAENYYYYEQLDSEEQTIYDTLYMLSEDPVSEDNYNVYFSSYDPQSEECSFHIAKAFFALTFDHPELFWLYNSCETSIGFASDGSSLAGKYPVYLYFTEPFTDYEKMQTEFNDAAETFLEDIDLTAPQDEIAYSIHDKLINTVTYDYDILNAGDDGINNLGHTAYGALVANSEGLPNHAVCDGYSLAYIYLLQQAGLDAAFIGGEAGDDEESTGGHAWSVVKINENWYEVDSTWDDMGSWDDQLTPDIEGYEYYVEALSDIDYRERLEHQFFRITTEEISNYVPDSERLSYTTSDGQYELVLAFDSVHIRDNASIGPYGEVIDTAPIAK